jgi:signal transduction histidine kinase
MVAGNNGAREQSEVRASIAQELRRPVSSIIGYTDLLLGESVGLLGAMQRKFLERVKASTERMGGLLDELINATTLEIGGKDLHPTAVDLNAVIDEALAAIIANLSERNIALRVDLPDDIPQLNADRDALLQILTNLLQNAGMVTPVDGEIWLRTRVEVKENEPGYVLVQVTDSGGGIPSESLTRVFSRLYRSDNQSIQGVGDNGVGLAIVKTLVEAHGGRIWVDSEMGNGATYSVLLPVVENNPEQAPNGGDEA